LLSISNKSLLPVFRHCPPVRVRLRILKIVEEKKSVSTYLSVLTHGLSTLLLEQPIISERLKRGGVAVEGGNQRKEMECR
jgi:hypothetical protein